MVSCGIFTVHQFRRTFARFVARHVLGDLYYLSHHFKHWSIDMTAYYANEAMDHELLGDISKTREDLQQSIVARWFDDGSPFAGGAAERLTSFRSSVLTAKNRAELLSQIAEDAYIRGTVYYSWYLSAPASASGSLCVFEKILCIECPNGVIDRGTRITVTSVAREAGVNRTTLPNHHADIVAQIHDLKKDGTGQQPGPQYSALAETRRQQKVLRAIIEQLPKDKERLAQHNYALRRENEGLKSQLTRKSQMLREFTRTRNAEDTVGPGESS